MLCLLSPSFFPLPCKWQQREKAVVFGVWTRGSPLDGEVLSVQGDIICLALFISCFCFSSWWLDARVFPSRPPWRTATKGCFFLLSWSVPPLPFLPLFRRGEMSQKSVHSHATAASKISSLSLLWRIYLNTQYWVRLVCFTGWTIKSPCGMLMSGVLLLNIPLALYDLCVQQSRGSLVMGLARLVENMMGVLICQQVVLLNDGRADSPVECSSGWVGCGMTVWARPSFSYSAPSVNEPKPPPPSTHTLFVQGGGLEVSGIPNLHKRLPGLLLLLLLTFVMWEEIMSER